MLAKCKDLSQEDRGKLQEVREWRWPEPTVEIDIPRKYFYQFRDKLKRQAIWTDDLAKLRRGRGGRVQYRIVAELPDGISDGARLEILQAFAARLEALKVMYTAVIHEPDEHNDRRNYHLHIAFYDRPCKYLFEEECWDFEIRTPVPGQRGRSKASKRNNKSVGVAQPAEGQSPKEHGREFVKTLRSDYASICNELLRKSGSNRLFDPRSFEAMGIDQEPTVHLGRAEKLDSAGVTTEGGILNAQRTWQGAFNRAEETLKALIAERTRALKSGDAVIAELKAQNATHTKAADLMGSMSSLREVADNLSRWERQAMQLHLTKGMLYSRAHKTEQRCRRLQGGDASKKSERQQDQYARRLEEAQQYREMLDREFLNDLQRTEIDHARLEALQRKATKLVREIDALAQAIGETPSTKERMIEPTKESEAKAKSRFTQRERAQVSNMHKDPPVYEQQWNEIIKKIERELLIQAPSGPAGLFKVPGISKADLDVLMNPILMARTQGRLRAIFERRNERGEPDGIDRTAGAVAQTKSPRTVEAQPKQLPASVDGKWGQLKDQALAKHAQDREAALNGFMKRIKFAQNDNFEVAFRDGVPRLALSAFKRLHPDDRYFAKFMKGPIDERATSFLIECRDRFSEILTRNPDACKVSGQQVLALMKNFPEDLHPHLRWLEQDPALKSEFDRIRERDRVARERAAAEQDHERSRDPSRQPTIEKSEHDMAQDAEPQAEDIERSNELDGHDLINAEILRRQKGGRGR
nr:MobA/MobL family protein [Sphingomicrobium astaxanthinifaciens]